MSDNTTGNSELLTGERGPYVDDLRLIARAANRGWNVKDEHRQELPQRIYEIAMTTDDERTAVNAAKALVAMDKANIDREKKSEPKEGVTVNVGVNVDARPMFTADERNQAIIDICRALLSDSELQRIRHILGPVKIPFCPHHPFPKQLEFLSLDCREAMYGGAAGGGKSDALLMAALQYVDVPGYSAILFRRTHTDHLVSGALADRSKQWLMGTPARWSGDTMTWKFPSGAKIQFGYLSNPNDIYRYQSSEFQLIGFDELTQFKESEYLYLFSRLRKVESMPVPLRMRSATNPGGIGHDWVKQRFIADPQDRVFVPAKLQDNYALDQDSYIESLGHLLATDRQQLLDGDWDASDDGLLDYQDMVNCTADCLWPDGIKPQGVRPELFIGVDQGRTRDLSVIWTWERLGDVLHCRECFVMDKVPGKIQKSEIRNRINRWVVKCGIDQGAQGYDVAKELEMEYPGQVEGVSLSPGRQGQMAVMLHAAFQSRRVRIPDDHTIRQDFRLVRRPNVAGESPTLKTDRDITGHADRFWAAAIGYWLASSTLRRPTGFVVPRVIKRF